MLEVRNLSKRFGGVEAVKNVDFTVKEKEIVGIIGPNGAGKTTIFNLITGFLRPDDGEIFFEGENITNLKTHQRCRRGIARTFQLIKPFETLTLLDNLTVGALPKIGDLKKSREEAMAILEFLGLSEYKNVTAKHLTLEKKRLMELGRALCTKPKLLLLDEIMAGLTPTECENLSKMIARINENGVTIVLIEHVMRPLMALSKKVIVINYGVKIAEGTPLEISRNEEVIEAYLGSKCLYAGSK